MKHTLLRLIALLSFATLMACADDTSNPGGDGDGVGGNNNGVDCPAGQTFNPVLGRCIDDASGNNGSGNNTSGNNTSGNNNGGNNTSGNNTGGGNNTSGNNDNNTTGPGENNIPDPNVCGYGSLKGKACAPSGEVLGAATVTITGVDCNQGGAPFTLTAQTLGDGSYSFDDVPTGQHEVTISTGGSFSRSFPAQVFDAQETDLTSQAAKYCIENDVEIAVIAGAYDDVEGVLDQLGLEYDMKGGDGGPSQNTVPYNQAIDFLTDLSAMSNYDIIFINCGELWGLLNQRDIDKVTGVVANLRQFIDQGKSVYASDWAHMFIERPMPNAVDFLGDDLSLANARDGFAPQVIQASVDSLALRTVLGTETVAIDFPHNPPVIYNNNWTMVEGADPNAIVHLTGDADRCAAGSIITGACPNVDGTLAGSPLLVSFRDPNTNGAVVYTSFHNHADEAVPVSPEIEKILKFLIFQL